MSSEEGRLLTGVEKLANIEIPVLEYPDFDPGPAPQVVRDKKARMEKLAATPVQGVVDGGKVADQKALDLVNGKGDIVDVVTAISQTEVAMETMVTVRDRVISAYEEIMRMPI